jgi:hypothetical protein
MKTVLVLFLLSTAAAVPGSAWAQETTQPEVSSDGSRDNCETVGNVTRCESASNLGVSHSLRCMPLSDVRNEYTPADIYPAVADCISADRYPEAVDLFLVAGVYAYFDKLRVADRTAHQAAQVLILNNFAALDADKRERWKAFLSKRSEGGRLDASGCDGINRLGPPRYFPGYMIQHGMQAFLPETGVSPLVESLDEEQAWQTAMIKYLHCPEPAR